MVGVDGHGDNTADGRVLNGVFHEVLEEHEQRSFVRFQDNSPRDAADVHIYFAAFPQAAQIIGDILRHRGHVNRLEHVILSLARFGQMQQLIDLARHEIKIMQQDLAVAGAAHFDLRPDQSQWSFQFMGRICQECALYVVSFFQPIEREIERFDNREEFDRKISRRQSLRYVMRIDACRGGGGVVDL